MAPDHKRLKEAEDWLRYAAEDLDSAQAFFEVRPKRPRQFLFCLQQCVDKTLKAMLIGHGQRYPLTHDLDRLKFCARIWTRRWKL